jgi:hypothetical protein
VQDLQDTLLDLIISGSCRGLLAKTPFFFLYPNRSGNRGPPVVLVAPTAGDSGIQELDRVGEKKGGIMWSRRGCSPAAVTRGGSRNPSGGGEDDPRLESVWVAVVRHSSSDGKGWKGCGLAS